MIYICIYIIYVCIYIYAYICIYIYETYLTTEGQDTRVRSKQRLPEKHFENLEP
jgi:hypothetical protein